MEQREEFEAWEKEQLAKQNEYRLQAEKESNEVIKNLRAKRGRDFGSASDQEFAYRLSNAFNDY